MARPGRPTLYKPEYPELAIPGFAEGVKQGRDIADAAVVQKLYARATGRTRPEIMRSSFGRPRM